jgi:hypothetical protein
MRSRSLGWAVALLLSSCGYRFTAGGGELPGKARTLHVGTFVNRTAEPEVEAYFTAALRRELARAGREGGEGSDARVEGAVIQVTNQPGVSVTNIQKNTTQNVVTTYRVSATAIVRVFRGAEQLVEIPVTGVEDFAPGVDCAPSFTTVYSPANAGCVLEIDANRRLALRRLASQLMRQAYDNLAAGF